MTGPDKNNTHSILEGSLSVTLRALGAATAELRRLRETRAPWEERRAATRRLADREDAVMGAVADRRGSR